MAYPCRIVCLSEETADGLAAFEKIIGQWRSACGKSTGSRVTSALRLVS
jgi:hypothetical protein